MKVFSNYVISEFVQGVVVDEVLVLEFEDRDARMIFEEWLKVQGWEMFSQWLVDEDLDYINQD